MAPKSGSESGSLVGATRKWLRKWLQSGSEVALKWLRSGSEKWLLPQNPWILRVFLNKSIVFKGLRSVNRLYNSNSSSRRLLLFQVVVLPEVSFKVLLVHARFADMTMDLLSYLALPCNLRWLLLFVAPSSIADVCDVVVQVCI